MSKAPTKTEDEKVNGPAIAAKILQAMPQEHRGKILKAMEAKAPELSIKVADNMFNFNDIASLTTQGVQVLLGAIDHRDLVMSFKTASPQVKEMFLSNMSERKAAIVNDDFLTLGKVKLTDVEDAQRRILKILDDLRTSGQIRSQSKNDVWV
jgi:flagellar motor switch protein FliG